MVKLYCSKAKLNASAAEFDLKYKHIAFSIVSMFPCLSVCDLFLTEKFAWNDTVYVPWLAFMSCYISSKSGAVWFSI